MSGGFILKSIQYSVWCATCLNLEDYDIHENKTEAAKYYRQRGWRKTKLGWQCKECVNQPRKEQDVAPDGTTVCFECVAWHKKGMVCQRCLR